MITSTQPTTHRGNLAQFMSSRLNGVVNQEGKEAFLKELYQVVIGLVLCNECFSHEEYSKQAIDTFPLITDKNYAIENTEAWMKKFGQWEASLTRAEQRRLKTTQMVWA